MKRKRIVLASLLVIILGFVSFLMHKASHEMGELQFGILAAHAEEDDDDGDEDDNDDGERGSQSQTYNISEKTVVSTVIKNVKLLDGDRDGIPDEQDPHPTIAEIYIVNDDNKNGIVDSFDLLQ